MTDGPKQLRVFISYASEDRPTALNLRDLIIADGHSAWIDQDILPGQQWEGEIERNLKAADVVVIVLSHSSVDKRGFVQREAAKAVAKLDDLRPDDIYIIPIRIDNCEPPERISGRIQFIDLHRDDARQRISTSLRIAARDRGIPTSEAVRVGSFSIHQRSITDSLAGKDGYENTFEYPEVRSTNHPKVARDLTDYFAGRAAVRKIDARPDPFYEWDAPDWAQGSTRQDYLELTHAAPPLVSALETMHWYSAGAAHGNMGYETLNFVVSDQSISKFSLQSITDNCSVALRLISDLCVSLLSAEYWERTGQEADEETVEGFRQGAGPDWQNFDAFTVDAKGVTIYFPPYQVSGYVLGSWTVLIPRFELRKATSFDRLLWLIDQSNKATA